MSASKNTLTVEEIDKVLGAYYKHFGKEYFNDDGIGKFQFYVDDNGFDNDDLKV